MQAMWVCGQAVWVWVKRTYGHEWVGCLVDGQDLRMWIDRSYECGREDCIGVQCSN